MFILHFDNESLHTANIQNLPVLVMAKLTMLCRIQSTNQGTLDCRYANIPPTTCVTALIPYRPQTTYFKLTPDLVYYLSIH